MNVARGKRQTKRQKKAVERTEAEQRRDRVIQTLTGRLPTVPASSWFPPATHTRSAQPIPIDGVYLVNPQPDFSQLEHRLLREAYQDLRELARNVPMVVVDSLGAPRPVQAPREFLERISSGRLPDVSMGTSVGHHTPCPDCDEEGRHWGEPMIMPALRELMRRTDIMKNRKRPSRPLHLGELMKKGGRSIDQIINDRVGDYRSLDKPRDPGFTNYLKDTYRWSGREARRQWRALLDRDIDPAVILNTRRATWRKTAQKVHKASASTSGQNPAEPLSRHVLYSTSSL